MRTYREHTPWTQKVAHPLGGQHRSPQGVTTWDSLSEAERHEDYRRRLEDFNRELEAAVNAEFGG
jgi:hypothetical protein